MRTKFILHRIALILAVAFTLTAQGEEKNGLLVSVIKKTLDRSEIKNLGGYSTTSEKTQGLGISIKNTSIREMPAGEVQWTIIVRKSGYTGLNGLYKYSGKEALKALRPSSSADLMVGAAPTEGYRSDYYNYKDKIEYEVVVIHDGKETLRTSSDNNFAVLAKRATSMDTRTNEAEPRRGRGELSPAEPAAPATTLPPRGTVPPRTDLPPRPATTLPPATPGTVRPAQPKPVEPKPAPVPATPATPAEPAPAPTTPDPAAKPFDFFQLDKKK